ncbi:hypothetical protein [Longimicrobium sp.]|uniref:hypothetical protein n=1 Tax=Longimicrobium sp. TaxID=2029185 RepID=UPI002E36DBF0|nr:hypothetical protein [Longimicrobium sp.]HEX6040587.1 hypothetical protein [Longimicrobium sp.]
MRTRWIINLAATAVMLTGGYSLSAQRTQLPAEPARDCCDAVAKVCYRSLGDGIVIQEPNSYWCG